MNRLPRLLLAMLLLSALSAHAAAEFITVASTTSTEQSGLFAHVLPMFSRDTGIGVHVVALGTGQALDLARRGDADVVFVHDREAEERFLAEGYGVQRFDVMYNDFVLVGPQTDPARVRAGKDIAAALRKIAQAQESFVSRGDRSGTHAAELRLWKIAGIDLEQAKGPWYRETGASMGPALNTAAAMNAYVLADRGTWLSFRNRQDLVILVQGDERLFNQYGVMLVNPAKHPHVKTRAGRKFIDWMLSPAGQQAIAAYRIDGEQLFFPDAAK